MIGWKKHCCSAQKWNFSIDMYITILYCDTCMILTRSIFFCFQILGKQLPLDFPIVFPLGQPSVTRESPGFSQGRTVYDDLVQEPVGAESGVIVAYAECRRNNHWSWITSGCKVLTYLNLIFLKNIQMNLSIPNSIHKNYKTSLKCTMESRKLFKDPHKI